MPYSTATVGESTSSGAKPNNSRQRRKPTIWTREKIHKLIELYRGADCLWNHYSELYKNKECRTKAIEQICNTLGITKNDYGKKVHNLRNQFNSELKKYERRVKDTEGARALSPKACRWEHFETLMFLQPIIEPRPGYQIQSKKTLKNESTNAETNQTAAASQLSGDIVQLELLSVEDFSISSAQEQITCELNVTSADPAINTQNLNTAEKQNYMNPQGNAQPGIHRDQWDAFGELIANEFRNLNSAVSRKKLKRKIMQIMLEVGEEDDEKYTSSN